MIGLEPTGIVATQDAEAIIGLVIDIELAPDLTQPKKTAQGMSTVGYHCVNAVPDVCQAPDPGIKTFLDLPMTTGRTGSYRTPSRG